MTLVAEMLVSTARGHPHKEAVVSGQDRMSYRELHTASTKLARFLRSRGIGPGDRVGVFANKGVEEVVAIFAILRAGATLVHINPQYREQHLRHVISDCSIRALFVSGAKSHIVASAGPFLSVDFVVSLSPDNGVMSAVVPRSYSLSAIQQRSWTGRVRTSSIRGDDVGAIIYTSGSTGLPKGVIVTHEILSEATTTSAAVLENTSEDRLISVTPFSFDGALSQLLTACLVGGTLVQQPSTFARDIVRTLIDERITGFHAVPSLWNVLLSERSPFADGTYPHLRYVSIIGESFPEKPLARLRRVLPTTDFYMMYGTTEAFRSTYLPPADFDRKRNSVGIPFPGVEISVVDDHLNPCPPGCVGNIVHRGAFVSPGYWNDAWRTAATFKAGGLWTGDLGMLDADGYLHFVGRNDGLIKVQGFRVSPEEVEQHIRRLDDIVEAAVVGVPQPDGGAVVEAVVVVREGAALDARQVIRHCRDGLPPYMVPTAVRFRRELRKTAGHKIDRASLSSSA